MCSQWGNSVFVQQRLRTRGADALMHHYHRYEGFLVPLLDRRSLFVEAPPGWHGLQSPRGLAIPMPLVYTYFSHPLLSTPRASEYRGKDTLLCIAHLNIILFTILAVLEACHYSISIYSRNPVAALHTQADAWPGCCCNLLFSMSDAVSDAVEAFGITDAVHDTHYASQAKDVFRCIQCGIRSGSVPFCGYSLDTKSFIPIREQNGSARSALRYFPEPNPLPFASRGKRSKQSSTLHDVFRKFGTRRQSTVVRPWRSKLPRTKYQNRNSTSRYKMRSRTHPSSWRSLLRYRGLSLNQLLLKSGYRFIDPDRSLPFMVRIRTCRE